MKIVFLGLETVSTVHAMGELRELNQVYWMYVALTSKDCAFCT
jgi:hypothetical protein